jgi:DNA-binding NtrC family response regulator/pSer/pThr/pTyr-binding forkhead associated (FHA) protein
MGTIRAVSRLLATHGHHFGVSYELLGSTTIGRSSGCTIQLLDEKASRLHSSVRAEGGRWVLHDEGSSNGTGLNGRLVLEPTPLNPGDEIAIGDNLLLFDPSLEILRDVEGAGAIILADSAARTVPGETPAAERPTFRSDAFLHGLSDLVASPRGLGRPAALLEAAIQGLHGSRGALLTAPVGEQPAKAIATWPHRSRITLSRRLLLKVLEQRALAKGDDGLMQLTVDQGRSTIEGCPGASMAVPLQVGGRVRGILYVESDRPRAFSGLPTDVIRSVLTVAFSRVLSGDPADLRPPPPPEPREAPVAESPAMQAALEQARALVDSDGPLLLEGERGTGKEYLARWLHSLGPRSAGPYVSVRCSALPEATAEAMLAGHEPGAFPGADRSHAGLLEQADGGTLMLDDIEALPPTAQTRLLRAIQEGRLYRVGGSHGLRIDVRVIAGTTADLAGRVGGGSFRAGLWEQLRGQRIALPPLRERLADIEPLLRRFVAGFNRRNGTTIRSFGPESVGLLESHDWPRNVDGLLDVAERLLCMTTGKQVEVGTTEAELRLLQMDLTMGGHDDLSTDVEQQERKLLVAVLQRCRGDLERASRMLRVEAPHLKRWMALHRLDRWGR